MLIGMNPNVTHEQDTSSNSDKKNEIIDSNDEKESNNSINSIITELNLMGYPFGTINWWENEGYDLETILQLRKAGIPIQEILHDFYQEDDINYQNETKLDPFTRTKHTLNPLSDSIQICSNGILITQADQVAHDCNNESNIIVIEYNNSNDEQEISNDQKIVTPQSTNIKRSENFYNLSEIASENNNLTANINHGKNFYENAIKPGLENMVFDPSTHSATFLTFAENMTFCLLKASRIIENQYGLKFIIAMLNFYDQEFEITKATFQTIQNKFDLSQVLSNPICSEEDKQVLKKIAFDHVTQILSIFEQTLNNLKFEPVIIETNPQLLTHLYQKLIALLAQRFTLKFECAQILQNYNLYDLPNATIEEIGSSGKTLEWILQRLLTETFHDQGAERQCLINFHQSIEHFTAKKQTSLQGVEVEMQNLITSLQEIVLGWVEFSQELSLNDYYLMP